MRRCKVNGAHVEPCKSLEEACDGSPPSKRSKRTGVFVWAFTNLDTGKPSRTLYGVKSEALPSGLIFNLCPFCGTDLRDAQGASGEASNG